VRCCAARGGKEAVPVTVLRDCLWGITIAAAVAAHSPALTAQNSAPKFERTACDFPMPPIYPPDFARECGFITVPENRANPGGRSFRLAVVVYRAKEPDGSPPLLLLHGGPGGIGGTRPVWADIMQLPLARKRDVVTFDMRGVGDSEPNRKLCPELGPKATPAFNPTKEKWEETYRAAIRECVASLDAQGFDRSAYGPDVSAVDAIDLRHALGYEKWDLYGASYGGIVAQEMMRRDPQATHAVVLLSAYPAGSPDYTAKFVWMFQQNLYHVFAECAAQPHCQRAFPTLQQDFLTLFEDLSAKPVQVPIRGSSPPRTVLLNGERFLVEVRREFRTPGSIRRLPLLINEMRRGDRAAAFERLIGDGVIPPGGALGSLVQCNEAGARYSAALAAMQPKLQHPFEMIAADVRDECAIWIANPAHQIDQTPMASSIPILVLHGEFDPMDNPTTQLQLKAHSKQAMRTYSRAKLTRTPHSAVTDRSFGSSWRIRHARLMRAVSLACRAFCSVRAVSSPARRS
jgi:pimeloyl-ACP methyl ester carboxylesterase